MTPQTALLPETDDDVEYPESDGLPMADNTLQYQWITTIVAGLRALFDDNSSVFVAGDLYWYPVKGSPGERLAPDGLVAFGRPKGHRGSYKQWIEGNIPPQVVFEVRSPRNTDAEMAEKRAFYERHGVQEFYDFDPRANSLHVWVRRGSRLERVQDSNGWVSPLLTIRFDLSGTELRIAGPDGFVFGMPEKHIVKQKAAEAKAARLDAKATRLEAENARLEAEKRALERRLRDLGIEP